MQVVLKPDPAAPLLALAFKLQVRGGGGAHYVFLRALFVLVIAL